MVGTDSEVSSPGVIMVMCTPNVTCSVHACKKINPSVNNGTNCTDMSISYGEDKSQEMGIVQDLIPDRVILVYNRV